GVRGKLSSFKVHASSDAELWQVTLNVEATEIWRCMYLEGWESCMQGATMHIFGVGDFMAWPDIIAKLPETMVHISLILFSVFYPPMGLISSDQYMETIKIGRKPLLSVPPITQPWHVRPPKIDAWSDKNCSRKPVSSIYG
ncbi:hypothetical protein Tco_1196039, partial [Tanacetum coccineum]